MSTPASSAVTMAPSRRAPLLRRLRRHRQALAYLRLRVVRPFPWLPWTSWRTPSTTSSARSTTSPLVWRLRRDMTRRAPANPLRAPCTTCQGTWPHLRGRSSSTPRWHHYGAHHTDLVSPFAIPDTGFFRAAAVSASVPSTSTAAALPRAPS
jgi:hypothetical protein